MKVDDQLRAAQKRREQALDLLIRSLIEIDTLTDRIDVLLDRKQAATSDID
jgi:hypothetical protein